ncbi:MAG: P-II family nitrogen regulator [Magnetococcales bacterium]|nr:P-II family nitrogen regulator [Magnetococcales bacterium]MBF0584673.1 P-II family nitrogen regulator [Magnetococcales bacterium]
MRLKLVVVTTRTHLTERLMQAAKRAGATGATVLPARGVGMADKRSFLGLSVDSQRDVLFFLLEESLVLAVTQAMHRDGGLDEPGTGMLFVLDVEQAMGLKGQLPLFETEIRERYN